jgi:hypothetical protein
MGIPTALAAIAQLAGSIISSKSKPNPAKTTRIDRFTKPQQGYQNQILGGLGPATSAGLSNLQGILSNAPGAFEAFEAPFKRQFQQETVPYLAERFSGLGSGAQSSSAFQQALGQAGAGLSQNLAALRGGLQQNALQSLLGFGTLGMQPSFESIYAKPTPGAGALFGTSLGQFGAQLLPYGLERLLNSENTQDASSLQNNPEFISLIKKLFEASNG